MKEKGEKQFLSVSTVTIEPAIIVSICICFEKSNKPNFTWDKACCMMYMYSVSGKAVRKYCWEERHRRGWTKIRISKCLLEQRSFGGLENSCFSFGGKLVWLDGVAQGLCVFTWHLGKRWTCNCKPIIVLGDEWEKLWKRELNSMHFCKKDPNRN